MAVTIDSLANETLSHIMELLKGPTLPGWDDSHERQKGRYDSLRAAALVCSRWRDPAQRALFDELHLPGRVDPPRGELFCVSSARPRCRTRALCAYTQGVPNGWLPVAKACTGLERLTVLDDSEIPWDQLSHSAFHGLKHLTLLYPENFKDPADPSTTLPFHLTSLSLWLDHLLGASPSFFHALATSSISSITMMCLKVTEPVTLAHFTPAFQLLGPRLRTLVLAATSRALHGHFLALKTLESLAYLKMNLDTEGDGESGGFEYLGAVLDALPSPPTLKHLVLEVTYKPLAGEVQEIVEHKVLASLVRLEFEGCEEEDDYNDDEEEGRTTKMRDVQRTLLKSGVTLVIPGI